MKIEISDELYDVIGDCLKVTKSSASVQTVIENAVVSTIRDKRLEYNERIELYEGTAKFLERLAAEPELLDRYNSEEGVEKLDKVSAMQHALDDYRKLPEFNEIRSAIAELEIKAMEFMNEKMKAELTA